MYPTAVSTSYFLFSKSISDLLELFKHLNHASPLSTTSLLHKPVYGMQKLRLELFLWVFEVSSNWSGILPTFQFPPIFDNIPMLRSFWNFVCVFFGPGHLFFGFLDFLVEFHHFLIQNTQKKNVPTFHFPIFWQCFHAPIFSKINMRILWTNM